MDEQLHLFLEAKNLKLVESLGKGHSSHVFLVGNKNGKRFVAKKERSDSTRFKMVEREAENLAAANRIGVGPKLIEADPGKRIILMEFIEGKTFSEWLFSGPGKQSIKLVAEQLLKQGKALDSIGLDHGQLAGRGRNILVKGEKGREKPVIIDFEKASRERKCHNLSTMESFLFRNPNSAIAKKVREALTPTS